MHRHMRGVGPMAVALVAALAAADASSQTLYEAYRPYMERHERVIPVDEVAPSAAENIRCAAAKQDWAALIDATWGFGLSAEDELQVFDGLWSAIDTMFGGFHNLDVDLEAIRDRYRPEIASGVSRGRFAAILNHFSLALKDAHTYFIDREVNWGTTVAPGVPLLVLGGWVDSSRFGAGLTPLPDDTLLVYKVLPDHVLGLEPGDIMLGYDGVPWHELYQQLLAAELPIHLSSVCGSTDESMKHCLLMSAGLNWHLFDTIDIRKHRTGETVHYPTAWLRGQAGRLWGNEQLPVAGVPMPDPWAEDYVTWGIVDGTRVGYIYVASWSWEPRHQISRRFYDAIHALMIEEQTDGLIIDLRFNLGGYMLMAHAGYSLLFNERVAEVAFDVRGDPEDHLDMVPHPTFTAELFTVFGDPATYYDRPIAVLTGPGAVSNGDWESLPTRFHPMVRTFGKASNGAFTPSRSTNVDPFWWITAATGSGYLLDGHRYLAHTGVAVDEEVWLTPEDVAEGKDTVVEAALDWILRRTPRQPADRVSQQP